MNMTRVVAIGIGDDVGKSELYHIASPPHELNVVMAPDFINLTTTDVQDHVVRAVCGKQRNVLLKLNLLLHLPVKPSEAPAVNLHVP